MSLTHWLSVVWILAVLWTEYGVYTFSLAFCGWNDRQLPKVRAQLDKGCKSKLRDTHSRLHGHIMCYWCQTRKSDICRPTCEGFFRASSTGCITEILERIGYMRGASSRTPSCSLGTYWTLVGKLKEMKSECQCGASLFILYELPYRYADAVTHFREIFSVTKKIDTYFVPGNEDVG